MPDGSVDDREVVEQLDAVAVVALDDDGNVLLVRQYRHPFGEHQLEIPAGKLDVEGEAPDVAAQRELIEEVGVRAGRLDHLVTFRNSAGWTTEETHIYLGTDLVAETAPDAFEPKAEEADMELVRMPLDASVGEVLAGRLTDAKTMIGLLLVGRPTLG